MISTNVFVSNPGLLTKIKNKGLRVFLKQGSNPSTPLERKATFDYRWTKCEEGDCVNIVHVYRPGDKNYSTEFKLDVSDYILLKDWYSITTSVSEYPEFKEKYDKKVSIRKLVKDFEDASKLHGVRRLQVTSGLINESDAYESGLALKKARESIYDLLDIK